MKDLLLGFVICMVSLNVLGWMWLLARDLLDGRR